jgi:hypothetical protein
MTKVVSSNPVHGEVYSMQHYVIKFVSDLQQIGGFLWALWFPPPIKLTSTIFFLYISFLWDDDDVKEHSSKVLMLNGLVVLDKFIF